MPDLNLDNSFTLVVALPYVTSRRLRQALSTNEYKDIVFLSKDDLCDPPSQIESNIKSDHTESSQSSEHGRQWHSSLYRWWMEHFNGGDELQCPRPTAMSLQNVKTFVGRVLGLLSVVPIRSQTRPRVEVRSVAQAVSQVAEDLARIVLTPTQAAILASNQHHLHVCLTGCMGSGKTLLLQLQGRQWVGEGRRVVILNVRTTARGRAVGHVLEDLIARDVAGGNTGGSVKRYNTTLAELNIAQLKEELKDDAGSTQDVCFLLDELSPRHVIQIIPSLRKAFPCNPIWFASLAVARAPEGFQLHRLTQCLRCPPTVQLMLRELDLNPFHRGVYCTRSIAHGLSSDGPPVLYIHHKNHSTGVRPHDCVKCAEELVEFMKTTLRLAIPARSSAEEPAEQEKAKKRGKYVEAAPLSFRDVLLLVSLPSAYYQHVGGGRWETRIEDALKFIIYMYSSKFVSTLGQLGVPFMPVVDSTSAEIATPLEDKIVIADVLAVPSLERKVVIFLPGGQLPVDSEVDNGQLGGLPAASGDFHLLEREANSESVSPESNEPSVPPETNEPSIKAMANHKEVLRDQTLQSAKALLDYYNTLRAAEELPSPEEVKLHFQRTFGNTMVRYMEDLSKGFGPLDSDTDPKSGEDSRRRDCNKLEGEKLRMGMDLRGDSPRLRAAFDELMKSQAVTKDNQTQADTKDYQSQADTRDNEIHPNTKGNETQTGNKDSKTQAGTKVNDTQTDTQQKDIQADAKESEIQADAKESEIQADAKESEIQADAKESEIQTDAKESENQADAKESEIQADTKESENQADPKESEIQTDANESENQADTKESEIQADTKESEIQADAKESENQADTKESEIQANTKESEIQTDAKESENQADTKESEIQADTKESEIQADAKESENQADTKESEIQADTKESEIQADTKEDGTRTQGKEEDKSERGTRVESKSGGDNKADENKQDENTSETLRVKQKGGELESYNTEDNFSPYDSQKKARDEGKSERTPGNQQRDNGCVEDSESKLVNQTKIELNTKESESRPSNQTNIEQSVKDSESRHSNPTIEQNSERKPGNEMDNKGKECVPEKRQKEEDEADCARSKDDGPRDAECSQKLEDDGVKQSDLNRVRHAISSLCMDDQDSLFMASSRCLSQLIVIIP